MEETISFPIETVIGINMLPTSCGITIISYGVSLDLYANTCPFAFGFTYIAQSWEIDNIDFCFYVFIAFIITF